MFGLVIFIIVTYIVSSQDPTDGWLGYARAQQPVGESEIITKLEAYWINLNAPKVNINSFFSPWIGIGTSDRLNIIQCVNPWISSQWQIYTEYYQFQPARNKNSIGHLSYPGDIIYCSIEYKQQFINITNSTRSYYEVYHSDLTQNWFVNTEIDIQKDNKTEIDKQYIYGYFGFFTGNVSLDCNLYPDDNMIKIYNISIYFNQKLVKNPKWITSFYNDSCNNRAFESGSNDSVTIRWNITQH